MKKRLGTKKELGSHKNNDHSKYWALGVIFSLPAMVFAIYGQVLSHDFVNFDDISYVTGNKYVQEGLSGKSLAWAFTTNHASNWHPLTWISHILDYQFYELRPSGHHFTSIFLHSINAILLFIILRRMTGALWQSAVVSALFALHPLNVESVAWVAERKNVLSTFFWLMAMWAYSRYTEKNSLTRYLQVLLWLALGLMSKPMLVTLPFVLLLIDYWPLQRFKIGNEKGNPSEGKNISRLVIEKIPLLVLVIASSLITYAIQKSTGAVQSSEQYSPLTKIINALVSYVKYLEKMIWPDNLAVLYPHAGNTLSIWKGVVCAFLLLVISVLAIKMIKKAPYLFVGWFWYLGTLVPVIGIIQVGIQSMADRYAYIPLVGIFVVVVWGLSDLLKKWSLRNRVLAVSSGIIISLFAAVTWSQVNHWRNTSSLFNHTVKVAHKDYPTFSIAYYILGDELESKGDIDGAIENYKKALRLKPNYADANYSLGSILGKRGNYEEAIGHLKIAAEIDSKNSLAHNNLGLALSLSGNPEKAIPHFQEALRLNPNYAGAKKNLTYALMLTGR